MLKPGKAAKREGFIRYTETLIEINKKLKSLSEAEQRTAAFVLEYPEQVALLPLRHLAAQCGVSEPTILRFCRGLGFGGYQDFKMSLVRELLRNSGETRLFGGSRDFRLSSVHHSGDEESSTSTRDIEKRPEWKTALADTITVESQKTLVSVDDEVLERAAEALASADMTVTAGLGGAAGVAYILADSLTGLGKKCFSSHDRSYLQVLPGSLGMGDLVIGISHSGETEEIVNLVSRASDKGIKTISITNYEGAPLDRCASITLFTSYREDLLGSYSPLTRISELVVIAALIERVRRLMG